MRESKCKICRRLGVKLFLKGERCFSPKCALVKKPYPPGKVRKRRKRVSDFGRELRDKQKLKKWYNLKESQFKNYVKKVLAKRGRVPDTSEFLIEILERRLDNAVFRLGFAVSRPQAKQFVSHGHFLINGKKVNIPSYQLKKGDKISLIPGLEKKGVFRNLESQLKKEKLPSWLSLDIKKLTGEVVGKPSLQEAAPPVEIPAIFEFYSK